MVYYIHTIQYNYKLFFILVCLTMASVTSYNFLSLENKMKWEKELFSGLRKVSIEGVMFTMRNCYEFKFTI